jgi:dihydrofolate reductase
VIVSLIAAMADNRVIGREGGIPWDLPEDRARFRTLTMGHPVVMGRRTYESLPRHLDGRTVIVVTRNRRNERTGCLAAVSLDEALMLARYAGGSGEAFICGGEELYREALPIADRIYLTIVHTAAEGDVYFPELPPADFTETAREEYPAAPVPYTFLCLERRTVQRSIR